MTERQKRWLGYGIILVAIVAAGFLGVRYPIPEPPPEISPMFPEWEEEVSFGAGARYTPFDSVRVQHELNVVGAADFDSTLNVDGVMTLASVTSTGAGDFDSTLNVDGATTLNSTLDVDGGVSSGTGAVTVTDQLLVDGQADVIQLQVQGYTTQTANLVVFEQSDGTDVATVSNAGLMTLAGGVTLSDGDATVADDFIVAAQTAVSVTAEGGMITPTGTYQPLESAANYSSTLETSGFTTGTLLVLVNTVNHRLGITDTGSVRLSGNLFLDQYDSAILWFDGTNWVQLAESDN